MRATIWRRRARDPACGRGRVAIILVVMPRRPGADCIDFILSCLIDYYEYSGESEIPKRGGDVKIRNMRHVWNRPFDLGVLLWFSMRFCLFISYIPLVIVLGDGVYRTISTGSGDMGAGESNFFSMGGLGLGIPYLVSTLSVAMVDISVFVFPRFLMAIFFTLRFVPHCFSLLIDLILALHLSYCLVRGVFEMEPYIVSLVVSYVSVLWYSICSMEDLLGVSCRDCFDFFFSCFGYHKYVRLPDDGSRQINSKPFDSRVHLWFGVRLCLFILHMAAFATRSIGLIITILYVVFTVSVTVVDMCVLLYPQLHVSVFVFGAFRFVPGCYVLMVHSVLMLYSAYGGLVMGNLILAAILPLYIVALGLDIRSMKGEFGVYSGADCINCFLSCFKSKFKYVRLVEDGKRHLKFPARLCDSRILLWLAIRLCLFMFYVPPLLALGLKSGPAAASYLLLTFSIILIDMSVFVYSRFNLVEFLVFRFVPGCLLLLMDTYIMVDFWYTSIQIQSLGWEPRCVLKLPLYVVGLASDVWAYTVTKQPILHYLAWDIAVFQHRKELKDMYIENKRKLETGFGKKHNWDKAICSIEKDLKILKSRVELSETFVKLLRHSWLKSELESEERACALDMRIRRLCSVFNTELLSEEWSKCWIYMVEALESLSLRTKASPQWMWSHALVENIRWYTMLQSRWTPTEELFSYYLKHLCCLCPASAMSSVCQNLNFHCRHLDHELGNMVHLIEELFGRPHESLDSVKLIAGLDTRKLRKLRHKNIVPLICDSGLWLYRECLAEGQTVLADKWLALRFSHNVKSTDLENALEMTLDSLQMASAKVQLNGRESGLLRHYKLPTINFKSSNRHRTKPWWAQCSSTLIENMKIQTKVVENTEENSSVDTCATTKCPEPCNSRDWIFELTPDEQSELYQQKILAANQDAAKLFLQFTKISDYDMSQVPFSLISMDALNDRIVLKWVSGGVQRERETNIVKNVPYNCLTFIYNALENVWEINADWCRVEGLLHVDVQGASRIPLTGDSHPLLQTTSPSLLRTTGPFNLKYIFKQHKVKRDHNIDNYLADVRSQSVARYYVSRFREATDNRYGYLRMLNAAFVVVFEDIERRTIVDMMVREIHVESQNGPMKFDKFTNNRTYVNKDVDTSLLEAFSHFSHHDSEGALMVTDLQGWATQFDEATNTLDNIILLLTDPVIHCPSVHTKRFGMVNDGQEGIDNFYSKIHPKCNHICKELGLKRPNGG